MTGSRHYAWASNEAACRALVPMKDGTETWCAHCREPLRALADAFVCIHGRDFTYPHGLHTWRDIVVSIAHARCCEPPDERLSAGARECQGYHIPFRELLRDGLEGAQGWLTHLRGKVWWAPTYEYDVEHAHQMAVRFAKRETKAAEVVGRSRKASRQQRAKHARSLTTGTRTLVLERDGFRCRRCGATADDGVRLVVDHVTPVAKGGTADPGNLQTLCEPCNAGKSDRTPHEHDHRGRP